MATVLFPTMAYTTTDLITHYSFIIHSGLFIRYLLEDYEWQLLRKILQYTIHSLFPNSSITVVGLPENILFQWFKVRGHLAPPHCTPSRG